MPNDKYLKTITENPGSLKMRATYLLDENDSYIKNRLQEQMNYYHKTCMKLQKEYNWLSILSIVSTAFISVFTLAVTDWLFSKYIVAMLSAFSTVLTSILLLHKTKENQVNYRRTYEMLKTEHIFFLNGIEKYKDKNLQERRDLFIETCENLMQSEHSIWGNLNEIEEDVKKS